MFYKIILCIAYIIISSCSNYNFLNTNKSYNNSNLDFNYQIVFPQNKVNKIDISISKKDWEILRNDLSLIFEKELKKDPIYVPCTITFNNKTWNYVGFRLKGRTSLSESWRRTYKLPFRLNFDKFEDKYTFTKNQRFYGFDELAFSNAFADSSFIREKVVYDIFRSSNVKSSYASFYRVYIDYGEGSKYFGLYTMVEVPDKPMFRKQFKNAEGNLYKPEGNGAKLKLFDEKSFEKKTNEKTSDYSDVKNLVTALNASRDNKEEWRANLEKVFDVAGFLRYLSIRSIVNNWDSYGTEDHNYYLYNDFSDKLLHWIPWDLDLTLSTGARGQVKIPDLSKNLDFSSLDFSKVKDEWVLIKYLINDPIYYKKYLKNIEDFSKTSFEKSFIKEKITKEHNLIEPYIIGKDGEQKGYTSLDNTEKFKKSLEDLNNYIDYRHYLITKFLEKNNKQ